MTGTLTEQTFYRYVKCPHWVYFDAHHHTRAPHDPLLERLADERLIDAHERALLQSRPDVAEVIVEDPDEAFQQTVAFMREGRQTIYRAVLMDGHWIGNPDILERVEGKSRFGEWYYVAADIKRTREVHDEFTFQGCFYAALLARVQGTKPYRGYIITPDNQALGYDLEPVEAEFHLTLDEIELILAGQKPAHFSRSSCKQSPWFDVCHGSSVACRDLSLLNRIWKEEVQQLEAVGITTIDDLARRSIVDVENKAPMLRPDRLVHLRDQAVAIRDGVHKTIGSVDLPESSVELYFDMESDPLRDFDYLFGFLIVERGKEEYRAFFAKNEQDVERVWRDVCALIESYYDAPIYHYGAFEEVILRKYLERFGASAMVREAVERNLFDLNMIQRPAVIFPLTFYGLKDIATYLGFHWRSDDASGANSVVWFEQYLQSEDASLKQKIVEYNEDDVRATRVLKEWLVHHAV